MYAVPPVFNYMRRLKFTARISGGKDFFRSRLIQAASKPTILKMQEHLQKALDSNIDFIGPDISVPFMASATWPDADAVLRWIRQYPGMAAMIIALKDETEYLEALGLIDLGEIDRAEPGCAPRRGLFEIQISVLLTSPLSHGSDQKAGNATLFRRQQVLSTTGQILELPFYAGNALRGRMRDLLSDHFLRALDITQNRAKPPVALWFFSVLYDGGHPQSIKDSAVLKKLFTQLFGHIGDNGAVRSDGIYQAREMMPHLSALGCTLGNRFIPGRFNFGDLRPRCQEWGYEDYPPISALLDWSFLTRREDHEGHTENHSMIATTEVLVAGTELDGGADISSHASPMDRAVIAKGLQLLREHSLGASCRMGFGKCTMELPPLDASIYDAFLIERKQDIIDYLDSIGALDTSLNEQLLGAGAEKTASKKARGKKKPINVDQPSDQAEAPEREIDSEADSK